MNSNLNADDPALARRYGLLISLVAGGAAVLYTLALARRSYWAVAIPVTAGVLTLAGSGLLLGRVLMSTPDEPPDPE